MEAFRRLLVLPCAVRRERGPGRLARDPLLCGAFAALWVAALVPIWYPRFLPLLDLPSHLAAVAIWHHHGDPAWGFSRFYDLNLVPLPYWGYLLPVHALAYLLPIEVASKVFLSAYALALPVGVALLAHRMGRSPWLALFAFPLVFNMNLGLGFVTFCSGLAVLFYALWVLDRFLDAPSPSRGAALFVLSLVLYFCHVLPWLFFGLAAAILLACHGWRPRRIGAAAALMLPSVAVAIYGFSAAARAGTAVDAGQVALAARFDSTLGVLSQLPQSLIAGWPANLPYQLLIAFGALWLTVLLSARTDAGETPARAGGHPYRLELIAGLAALLSVALPAHLYHPVDLWMIGQRFVAVAALLFAILPHGPLVGRRKLIMVPVLVLGVVYPLKLAAQWRQFDVRAAGVRRLMARVPRGASTLTLVYKDGADLAVDPAAVPYRMFHAYPQLYAGGFDPWALSTGFPMVVKKDAALPAPPWNKLERFTFDEHGRHYDYILTHREIAPHAIFGADEIVRAPLVGEDGDWRLYQVRRR